MSKQWMWVSHGAFAGLTAIAGCTGVLNGNGDDPAKPNGHDTPDAAGNDKDNDPNVPDTSLDAATPSEDAAIPGEDAATTTPSGLPSCTGAWICDDFESGSVGAAPGAPWTTLAPGGSATIDTTRAASGTRSVHFHVDHTADNASAVLRAGQQGTAISPGSNEMWGRMMMYLERVPTYGAESEWGVHWDMIHAEGNVPGMPYRANYNYGGMREAHTMANYFIFDPWVDCWHNSNDDIPVGRWACVEWHFAGADDRMEFYIDGNIVSSLTVNGQGQGCSGDATGGQWLAPTFDTLWVGWQHYQKATNDIDLWLDDVAIDDTRIGCGP